MGRDIVPHKSALYHNAADFGEPNMGWLWLVGSLKLQVSFAKEPYERDDMLQKRPIILRSLLIVATPYQSPKRLLWGGYD